MKETVYIFTNGELKRKDNSLVYITEEQDKKYIPVENVKEILVFGETNINKKLLAFISQKEIILSYFNYYGYYMGSFYPREHYNSGYMTLKQATKYNSSQERLKIAKKFVKGASLNALRNIKYYDKRDRNLAESITKIENLLPKISQQKDTEKLMALEGGIKKIYYRCFNKIINNKDFHFANRNRRPPKDRINALISFSNSLIYTTVLGQIYHTHLDPRIGYLHSTNNRRFSLNLDIAEIFKPVIGDRIIFNLINKNQIKKEDFVKEEKGIMLNEDGRKTYLAKLQDRLNQTIKHSKLNKKVSYKRLIRIELYKLEKHLIGEEEYKPFVMEW
jgi:CRISPR-associated protein Cas1